MTKTLLSLGLGAGLAFGGYQTANQAEIIESEAVVEEAKITDSSLEDMLIIAIEDEYHARQVYEAIMDEYGVQNPFANIMKAEETHIDALIPLFETYQLEVPADVALDITIPSTLQEAYELGVQAEIDNIAIYEGYLASDLPSDVAAVFEELMTGSEHHLDAFERNATKDSNSGVPAYDGNDTENGRSNEPRRSEVDNKDCTEDAE